MPTCREWPQIFANAMYASAQPLGMLLFVMAIGCVVFSSAIYFAERGEWSEELEMYLRDEDGVMQRSPYASYCLGRRKGVCWV